MSTKRSFSRDDVATKSTDYHGSAAFVRTKPDLTEKDVKSMNIEVTFDEALKLSLALQSCLQSLNRYNRSTKQGREMGLLLSIKMDNQAISVIESSVRKKTPRTSEE